MAVDEMASLDHRKMDLASGSVAGADSARPAAYQERQEENKNFMPPRGMDGNKTQEKTDWDKKIIKTANLTLEVKEENQFDDFLHKMTKQFGGFIAQEQEDQSNEKMETTVTVKIPLISLNRPLPSSVRGMLNLSKKKLIRRM